SGIVRCASAVLHPAGAASAPGDESNTGNADGRMSSGEIVQIIGAVVDVEFPSNAIPKIYDALVVEKEGDRTTLEVQQQLGDGVVRTIALGSTDGLQRGLKVTNTGEPIAVPVGAPTLGRIMNVRGEPVD